MLQDSVLLLAPIQGTDEHRQHCLVEVYRRGYIRDRLPNSGIMLLMRGICCHYEAVDEKSCRRWRQLSVGDTVIESRFSEPEPSNCLMFN